MRVILLRISYAVVAIAMVVCSLAAVRPDLFGITKETAVQSTAIVPSDPLAEFEQEREQMRSMQLSQLDDMINSENTSPDTAKLAEEEKLAILNRYETEQTISGILRIMGYNGAVACAENDGVTILIKGDQPGESQIAAITETILAQTDVQAGNIKIIPIN